MNRPHKLLLVVALTVAILAGSTLARRASAQFLVADIGHTVQTVLHYAGRLIEISQKYIQIYNQYQQIAHQVRQIQLQLQSLKKLDFFWARNVVGTMGRMEAILAHGDLPSHMNPDVRGIFEEIYPGWQATLDGWEDEERVTTKTLETLRETLAAQYESHRTMVDHIRTLLELKNQVRSIEGNEEALETIAGLVAFHAEADTLSQLAAATSADAATAYYAFQVHRMARQERSLELAIESSELVPPALDSQPGWGALPAWWH